MIKTTAYAVVFRLQLYAFGYYESHLRPKSYHWV